MQHHRQTASVQSGTKGMCSSPVTEDSVMTSWGALRRGIDAEKASRGAWVL